MSNQLFKTKPIGQLMDERLGMLIVKNEKITEILDSILC